VAPAAAVPGPRRPATAPRRSCRTRCAERPRGARAVRERGGTRAAGGRHRTRRRLAGRTGAPRAGAASRTRPVPPAGRTGAGDRHRDRHRHRDRRRAAGRRRHRASRYHVGRHRHGSRRAAVVLERGRHCSHPAAGGRPVVGTHRGVAGCRCAGVVHQRRGPTAPPRAAGGRRRARRAGARGIGDRPRRRAAPGAERVGDPAPGAPRRCGTLGRRRTWARRVPWPADASPADASPADAPAAVGNARAPGADLDADGPAATRPGPPGADVREPPPEPPASRPEAWPHAVAAQAPWPDAVPEDRRPGAARGVDAAPAAQPARRFRVGPPLPRPASAARVAARSGLPRWRSRP
jgi:ribonuclease E